MPTDAAICLSRTWGVLVRLIIEISLMVSLVPPMARDRRLKALRLTRLAESIARRWLVLKACTKFSDSSRAGGSPWTHITLTDQRQNSIHGSPPARGSADVISPREPLFRLTEPEPKLRASDYHFSEDARAGGHPWTKVYPADPAAPLVRGLPPAREPAANEVSSPNQIHLWLRSRALLGVMREPERHTKRMGQWLARAAAARKTGPHRLLPLRPGRPPGTCWGQRRAVLSALHRGATWRGDPLKDPERQDALRDLNHFARAALDARAPP